MRCDAEKLLEEACLTVSPGLTVPRFGIRAAVRLTVKVHSSASKILNTIEVLQIARGSQLPRVALAGVS